MQDPDAILHNTTFVCPEKREEALRALRELFGIDLRRIVKWTGDPPTYSVFIGDQEVVLGDFGGLENQTHFRRAIASATDQRPKQVHRDYWDSTVDRMLEAMERVTVPLATQFENYRRWLDGYLTEYPPADEATGAKGAKEWNNWDTSLRLLRPVYNRKGVWIHPPDFQQFLWECYRENISHREIARYIVTRGGVAARLQAKEDRNLRPTYYLLPLELLPEHLIPDEITI